MFYTREQLFIIQLSSRLRHEFWVILSHNARGIRRSLGLF